MRSRAASPLSRLSLAFKALAELGPRSVGLFSLHLLGLYSGYYRLATPPAHAAAVQRFFQAHPSVRLSRNLFALPTPHELRAVLGEPGLARLQAEAEEIVLGKVRLFGAELVALNLNPPLPLAHWTACAMKGENAGFMDDIKFTWEPARFGWAFVLARAYRCTGDERYAASFWEHTEAFLESNPAYCGPHWASAQEVALRLIAMLFAWQVFAASPHTTPARLSRLSQAVALHARRIPPSMVYARAQNNNHLLSEAAGLVTAGLALPEFPQAKAWLGGGLYWFMRGLIAQIDEHGAYLQHSANYHRLMLHLALWVNCLLQANVGQAVSLSPQFRQRLAAATRWLLALHDPACGHLPNLGPNDGAMILPLSTCPPSDYRPVLQAAASAFLKLIPFPPGDWDESLLWLRGRQASFAGSPGSSTVAPPDNAKAEPLELRPTPAQPLNHPKLSVTPHVLRSPDGLSWAYFRIARFTSRPGHADQLHLDVWWRGLNVAQDAGTYLYNSPSPWNNPLAETEYHNTLTVNGLGQMRRFGRFLFLDWAQARLISRNETSITAEHDGYRRLGVVHRRSVSLTPDGDWQVEDRLLPQKTSRPSSIHASLHWLLPDWKFEGFRNQLSVSSKDDFMLRLKSPFGWVVLELHVTPIGAEQAQVHIARAGELVYGIGPVKPTWGWSSPTYGDKIPALSLRVSQTGPLPLTFTTRFHFPT